MHQHQAELNLLWGALIIEELTRLGVKHVCIAPGSRSTPLTLAVAAQDKLQQHTHFDERGLGFMALGLAKASNTPVAVITTSGTAVANLYPAIVEAWLTQVPLIVISGDRPPELLGSGANQAIVQPAIFGQYATQVNLPTPDFSIAPQALLTQLDESISNQSTPVHINCMYREPLYPAKLDIAPSQQIQTYLQPLKTWQNSTEPYTCYHISQPESLPSSAQLAQFTKGKGVIVAGTLSPNEDPQLLIELSEKIGWPLLVDAQSQLRQHPSAIGNIDQLLLQPKVSSILQQAENVLVFGGRFLSKRLITYLEQQPWQHYWQVLSHQQRLDPSHKQKQIWVAPLAQIAAQDWPCSVMENWANTLVTHNAALAQLMLKHIDDAEFGEAQAIRIIATTPHLQQLFIGNSLPVRLYDMYAPIVNNAPCVYTNRGASGIDGLIATAYGVNAVQQIPTTLVIGDLSALYDLNSLALLRQSTSAFVIVILNNDGGNIFNILPVPDEQIRSNYYRMSHGLTFDNSAAMFGLPYHLAESTADFSAMYQAAINFSGASIIEAKVSQTQASDQIKALNQLIEQS